MCGIAGGWWRVPLFDVRARINNALVALAQRGPDDRGFDEFPVHGGLAVLGHTRLSVIDLSSAGHQPMSSANGRYVLVFNGEIYNYKELRADLIKLGRHFVSDSDTEVLLAAWMEWGESCLRQLEGMFAFVVYDKQEHTIWCVRDAFGIKPFFYHSTAERFLFASEQRALSCLRPERAEADWQRGYDYLVHGDYDSGESTFVAGVKHLLPGHCLQVNLNTGRASEPECWWRPQYEEVSKLSFDQAAEAVREQFLQNIRLHLRSDVALGAALSGGIDSSAVVCAMRHIEPNLPIHTFSYVAKGSSDSEEAWIDRVNQHTGAIGHQVIVNQSELANDLDTLIQAQGEPFGSTSIYAQYRVYQLAKEQGITVTLDGQGADELLAGYSGYPGYRLLSLLEQGQPLAAYRFSRRWSQWPGRSNKQAWMLLGRVLLPDTLYAGARKVLGRDFSPSWLRVNHLSEAGVSFTEKRTARAPSTRGRRVVEEMAYSLQYRGLPSLLRHGDRNSMRFSVESRVPFLTLPMADLLLSLPENYLISSTGQTKSIFRAAMRGIVPDDVLNRKDKIGFATPEKDWLMSIAPTIRGWLQESNHVPFMNRENLIGEFDKIVAQKKPFGLQVWRWINYVRWHQTFLG
jgi:asparagine synthase (glutamine-hydrolysing)